MAASLDILESIPKALPAMAYHARGIFCHSILMIAFWGLCVTENKNMNVATQVTTKE